MYFLNEKLVEHALDMFKEMSINTKQDQIENGGKFFGLFGPGNIISFTDKPFERFSDYESLLLKMQETDKDKYQKIHKGTPFYFLAWTAFDLRNYEAGLFYLDAAISEDIKNTNEGSEEWIDLPAAQFLTFKDVQANVARRVIERFINAWKEQIRRFNSASNLPPFDLDSLINGFVLALLLDRDNSKRTILTALYTFVLEFEDRYTELELRSTEGGSLEPFLQHLFKGALIFESLLKHLYPASSPDKRALGEILNGERIFKREFSITQHISTSAGTLSEIVASIQGQDILTAFTVVSKIRNTTGHNLMRDDVFSDPETYRKLFEQGMNAVFYLIQKKYSLSLSVSGQSTQGPVAPALNNANLPVGNTGTSGLGKPN